MSENVNNEGKQQFVSVIKFDHSKKKFSKSTGLNKEFMHEFSKTCADVTKKAIKDNYSKAQLVEAIVNEFTPDQLVFASALFMQSSIDQIQSDPIARLLMRAAEVARNSKKEKKETSKKSEEEESKE